MASRQQVAEWLAEPTQNGTAVSYGVGLANGRVYLSFNSKIHMLSIPGLGLDYPRARALGQNSVPFRQLRYAALGDSFIAGEGNPEFEVGTDTAGPPENRCHRSKKAYPHLLGNEPLLTLTSPLFVACSGATTWNVSNGQWNEGPQLQAVGRHTDVVTISIGGNDAGFLDFGKACVNPLISCDTNSTAYKASSQVIQTQLQTKLEALYRTILARAPNAAVYVVGYPLITPPVATPRPPYACGDYLSDDEIRAADNFINGVNGKARAAIRAIGSRRLSFVDPNAADSPFIGHRLCSKDPYFYGIIGPLNIDFSFHPNEKGMRAFATLVREAMLRSAA